jgi:putative membrane protein
LEERSAMARLIIRLLINAVAIWAAASLVHGITFQGNLLNMIVVALIFGLVNAFVKPVVKFFAFPLLILTLGLLTLVINALMLMLTAAVTSSLTVDGFWSALLGSVVISVVSILLSIFLDDRRPHPRVEILSTEEENELL